MPHQTFTENRVWKFVSMVAWGLSCAQLWELWVLLILLWVNVASSVNKMYSNNSWLWDNQWQNCSRASSPGCRCCTVWWWNGYKPSLCNVRHMWLCGTRRHEAIRRVLVVGLCCAILTISSCSSTVCVDLCSDDTCTLGSVPHSCNAQNTLVKQPGLVFCATDIFSGTRPQLHLHCHYSTRTRKPCPHTLHVWMYAVFWRTVP